METKIIKLTTGQYAGQEAYVTYDDGKYFNVTPVDGDPLKSIEVKIDSDDWQEVGEE